MWLYGKTTTSGAIGIRTQVLSTVLNFVYTIIFTLVVQLTYKVNNSINYTSSFCLKKQVRFDELIFQCILKLSGYFVGDFV